MKGREGEENKSLIILKLYCYIYIPKTSMFLYNNLFTISTKTAE